MRPIAIISARRTPQGRFLGSLSRISAVELAIAASRKMFEDLVDPKIPEQIDQTIVGNVLGAGLGMNIARQISVGLNLPVTSPAFTVNMMCGSGMKAVMLGCEAISSGEAEVVLCGGTESMSQAPYLLPRVRTGLKLGDSTLVDSILKDGLVDAFDHQHMGLSAERLAREFQISREQQDAFAALSQKRCFDAITAGIFEHEIAPVAGCYKDEHPRPETTVESLSGLKPAFEPHGTVTAGNASGLNDGAAVVLLASDEYVRKNQITPLAMIQSISTVGCDPAHMGLGPVHAIQKILNRNAISISEYDHIEINEAFAAQTLACLKGLDIDQERVNPHGGAIALGHPIGASGARLIVHLSHMIKAGNSKTAIAALCVGGGMGVAMSFKKA